jgi:hypothetical protein
MGLDDVVLVEYLGAWLDAEVLWRHLEGRRPRVLGGSRTRRASSSDRCVGPTSFVPVDGRWFCPCESITVAIRHGTGEYGAVAVVSGRLVGRTQTVTLLVQERYLNFDQETAYACALLLVVIAVLALGVSRLLTPKEITR